MNILIIGGTGVISSAVVKEALRKNIKVTMINRGHSKKIIENELCEVLISDFHDKNKIMELLNGRFFDAVIDFICYKKDQLVYSFDLLKNYTRQYIFISSCAVYNTKIDSIKDENSEKVLDIWPYSVEKVECENTLLDLVKSEPDVAYTIIRPCVTYGDTRIPYGIMPPYGMHGTFIQRILNNKPIIRWNKGINVCNMLHVDDFAVGLVGLLGNSHAYNEVFNICGDSDKVASWNDVLNIIEKILNKKIEIVDITSDFYANEIPSRKGEILGGRSIDARCSNEKIKRIVPEFKHSINLSEGIKMTLDAYYSENWQKGIDYFFDGDTDRIIKKYSKKYNRNVEKSCLYFVDYLNSKKVKDRLCYLVGKYKSIRFLYKIMKEILNLKRIKK